MANQNIGFLSKAPATVEISILFTSFIAATYGFGVYLFSTVLPDMKKELLFSYTQAGQFISLAQVGFLLAALTSGVMAHKIGPKRLILISMLACCLSLLGLALVHQKWQVAVLLTLAGAAAAAVWVPMVAIAQEIIPAQHQGKAIGLMSSGTAYGVCINGLAVPIILPEHGWRFVWLFVFVISVLALIWVCIRLSKLAHSTNQKSNLPQATEVASAPIKPSLLSIFKQPACLIILFMMFFNGIACIPAQNYLMSYLREYLGYTITQASHAWTAIGLIGMVGGFVMGSVADKFSVHKSLVLTYLLLGIATGLFLHHSNPYEVYLAAAIFGLSFNAIFGLVPAFVSLNFSKSLSTLIFGIATVLLGLGSMLGNLWGGMIHDYTQSFLPIYQISTITAFVLALLALVLGRFSEYKKHHL